DPKVVLAFTLDADHRIVDQLCDQWDMPWHDANLPNRGAAEDECRLTGPNFPVDGNDLHIHLGHLKPPFAGKNASQLGAEAFSLIGQVVEAADQEECLLGHVVEVA